MTLVLATVGCSKVGQLTAMKNFKEANQAYAQQDYKTAAELYEQTVKADPNLTTRTSTSATATTTSTSRARRASRPTTSSSNKAVKNYQTAAEKLSRPRPRKPRRTLAQLSMKYLVASYGADKLNDPAQGRTGRPAYDSARPAASPTNYFTLAKIYEDAGAYENAEDILVKAKQTKPSDPAVYKTLAGYYNRQGQFEKTIKELEERPTSDPKSPEAQYTIAVFYWDEAFRDTASRRTRRRTTCRRASARSRRRSR